MLGALALNPAIPISKLIKPELLECCSKLAFVTKEQPLKESKKKGSFASFHKYCGIHNTNLLG